MKKQENLIYMSFRYLILLIMGLIMTLSHIFYNLLLPLTIYPTKWLLSLFYQTFIEKTYIFVDSIAIEIIPACVAVSAYFLLLILNLATPMKTRKRIYTLLFSFASLLLINIIRIFILSLILINEMTSFEIVHKLMWYTLSIIIVVAIWFFTIWLFKVKDIPIYSDMKLLMKYIRKH